MVQKINVYEASKKRIDFIFKEFDNIYLSFSGGKDSGVMLNLAIDYMKENNIKKKIGLLIVDLEAQYTMTMEYIEEMVEDVKDYVDLYWCCMPLNLRNSISNFQPFWTCWDPEKKDAWVRKMPEKAINIENHNFDFFKFGMEFEEFVPEFGKWYGKNGGKTACLVGIRTQESLNRWRTINSKNKVKYKDKKWTTQVTENLFNCYPIYDWITEDIWIGNGKNKWKYNKLYDYMYRAGLSIHQMRICQPYGDDQRIGLNLYKVIEPATWEKVVNRTNGVNFGNIYCGTKALGFNNVSKPENHTWESYTKFLLSTLPDKLREHYESKFEKFMKYWMTEGSPIPEEEYENISKQFSYISEKISTRGKKDKKLLIYSKIPDTLEGQLEAKRLAPSWKRMAYVLIKNDVLCKTLSFTQTKKQKELRDNIINKYKNIL